MESASSVFLPPFRFDLIPRHAGRDLWVVHCGVFDSGFARGADAAQGVRV